jgi:hypothetical protein
MRDGASHFSGRHDLKEILINLKNKFMEEPMPPQPDNSRERVEAFRHKQILALALGLGANAITAKMSADVLIHSESVPFIDTESTRTKNYDPKDKKDITEIGSWLLTGSEHRDQLAFLAGHAALSILETDPSSPFFQHLSNYIDQWTDGLCGKKFKEALKNLKSS